MLTLHERIQAAVEERLRLARAATPGPWDYQATSLHMDGSGTYRIATVGKPQVLSAFMRGVDPMHIAANDPADAILACEHALGILERHVVDPVMESPRCVCYDTWSLDDPWPCDEIRALATRYGVEIDELVSPPQA